MKEIPSLTIWIIIFLLLPIVSESSYAIQIGSQLLIYIILFIGLDIAVGHAGLISVAHGALFGIGAYASAILSTDFGWSFYSTIPLAIFIGMIVGLLIGLFTLHLAGHYFVLATVAFALFVSILARNLPITHGDLGVTNIPIPSFEWIPFDRLQIRLYYTIFVAFVITIALYMFTVTAGLGRRMRAMRDNSMLADALGIDIRLSRLLAFIISSGVAAFAGCWQSVLLTYISPKVTSLDIGFTALMALIIGGRTYISGAIIGGLIFTWLPEILRDMNEYRDIVLGMILITIIRFAPNGIYGIFMRDKR